jgi:hypothetical protein
MYFGTIHFPNDLTFVLLALHYQSNQPKNKGCQLRQGTEFQQGRLYALSTHQTQNRTRVK